MGATLAVLCQRSDRLCTNTCSRESDVCLCSTEGLYKVFFDGKDTFNKRAEAERRLIAPGRRGGRQFLITIVALL